MQLSLLTVCLCVAQLSVAHCALIDSLTDKSDFKFIDRYHPVVFHGQERNKPGPRTSIVFYSFKTKPTKIIAALKHELTAAKGWHFENLFNRLSFSREDSVESCYATYESGAGANTNTKESKELTCTVTTYYRTKQAYDGERPVTSEKSSDRGKVLVGKDIPEYFPTAGDGVLLPLAIAKETDLHKLAMKQEVTPYYFKGIADSASSDGYIVIFYIPTSGVLVWNVHVYMGNDSQGWHEKLVGIHLTQHLFAVTAITAKDGKLDLIDKGRQVLVSFHVKP